MSSGINCQLMFWTGMLPPSLDVSTSQHGVNIPPKSLLTLLQGPPISHIGIF